MYTHVHIHINTYKYINNTHKHINIHPRVRKNCVYQVFLKILRVLSEEKMTAGHM